MADLGPPQPVLQRERFRLRILTWRQQSQWFDVSYRVARERRGQIAIVILGVFIVAAIFADQIAPYHYETQLRGSRLLAPSWSHPFGTDEVSRDLLSRMIYGLRISLLVSLGAVAIGLPIGVAIGYTAGYIGRWVDAILMRLVDTMLAFPGILVALVILTVLGTGTREVAITLGIGAIPIFGRLARGQMLQEKERDYVMAARTLGSGPVRIIMRHVAINTLPPIMIQAALVMAFAVIAEASLSFLGLGASPPIPTIGLILNAAREFLIIGAWWFALMPIAALALMLIALNFLADAILEATSPYVRNK
ncbi:MAG: ABC transporter permease [Chloroflexi bacterium]|nr:ABC transporter permease [Chloroflexota bacterium]MCY3588332.1 ABC transporter permease [Chloroflexota bacterium]MCY3684849.1 ABC transporter permease [Chloroflexota bacterium]MDE2708679.1 ABC transporter permease [Chloroflexota bacterium]MDE2987385.1 ABC transporter permease [Chloroflexota bacterium]